MKGKTYKLSWWRVGEGLWKLESKLVSCEPTDKNVRLELPGDAWLDDVRIQEVL